MSPPSERQPKIVFVTDHVLNPKAGYGYRIANTLAGLRSVGQVTTVFLARNVDDNQWPGADDGGPAGDVITIDAREYRLRHGYPRSLLTRRPRESVYANRDQLADRLGQVIGPDTDLVWVFRARPLHALEPILATVGDTRLVVDFDDLYDEHYAILAQPELGGSRARRLGYRLDSALWRRYQAAVTDSVDLALVTSEVDRHRLGCPNVHVLPNGYPEPESTPRPPSTEPTSASGWRLLFVGGFHYPPNADAARQLATAVLPLVRDQIGDAELLLVGRRSSVIDEIEHRPGVRYLGFADDLDAVFDQADVVVTPIRSGAGSRLKAIEAMARGLPLVSSSFGVQGFEVTDGDEVLLADTAADQAAAVARLHGNPELRRKLVGSAFTTYRNRYSSRAVMARTAELARRCLCGDEQPVGD